LELASSVIPNYSKVLYCCSRRSVTDRELTHFVIPCLFTAFSLTNWHGFEITGSEEKIYSHVNPGLTIPLPASAILLPSNASLLE
jgi:hypothetical protein